MEELEMKETIKIVPFAIGSSDRGTSVWQPVNIVGLIRINQEIT